MPEGSKRINVLLTTLNAKYIHSSLALRYLQAYCQGQEGITTSISEFTINQPIRDIMGEIYTHHPDVLGFSCYIWNISEILTLCADYKKVAPQTVIILGGPEVSYDAEQILLKHRGVDCVVRGEGEESLLELLLAIQENRPWEQVQGISYRWASRIINNPDRELINDLDWIPFPYRRETSPPADRVVYYESSRGCPFCCSYCLSSASPGVRYLSMDRVKADLGHLLKFPLREIKFVDRTFNCDETRAREIIEFIVAQHGTTKIHLEIDAGLLSDGMLAFLETVPAELFNFEIGVQSTYGPTLVAVRRHQDWERLRQNIERLQRHRNINLHLDLIAGLPDEDYASFTRSFNMSYDLRPDMLQLGFLKMLKGSELHHLSSQYGYVYQSQAPYQVLANQAITYRQILELTWIEEMVEKYYNSGDMPTTVTYIIQSIYPGRAMGFYRELADYWQAQHLFGVGHKKEALYNYLLAFIRNHHFEHLETVYELLKYDFLCRSHRYGLPPDWSSHNPDNINDLVYAYARDAEFIKRNLTEFTSKTAGEIKKLIHIEYLRVNPHTFRRSDVSLRLMFVYNPLTRAMVRCIDLDPSDCT